MRHTNCIISRLDSLNTILSLNTVDATSFNNLGENSFALQNHTNACFINKNQALVFFII